jgi:predicted amidophosphoribosyltransferase
MTDTPDSTNRPVTDPAEEAIARARAAQRSCPDCGLRPEPNARFCSNCGKPLV